MPPYEQAFDNLGTVCGIAVHRYEALRYMSAYLQCSDTLPIIDALASVDIDLIFHRMYINVDYTAVAWIGRTCHLGDEQEFNKCVIIYKAKMASHGTGLVLAQELCH